MTGKAIIALTALAGVCAFFAWKLTARGAYESAEYTVVVSDGPFEVREYPDLMLAATGMQLDSQGSDGSFMEGREFFPYLSRLSFTSSSSRPPLPEFKLSKTSSCERACQTADCSDLLLPSLSCGLILLPSQNLP